MRHDTRRWRTGGHATRVLRLAAASGVALLVVGSGTGPAAAQVDNLGAPLVDEPTLPSWFFLGSSPGSARRVFPDSLGRTTGVPEGGQPALFIDSAPSPSALLADPRLTLGAGARADLANGVVDPRLTAVLTDLLQRHTLSIVVFRSGHSRLVAGTDVVSNHFYGRAVDVVAVDGEPVTPASQAARQVVLELVSTSSLGPFPELGQPWPDLVGNGVFTDARHLDHLHIGLFDAQGGRGA